MLIYYLTPEKKDLYFLLGSSLKKGLSFYFKTPFIFFQKRVLILGKELTTTYLKRYPPLSPKELSLAVSNDIPDLFPSGEFDHVYVLKEKTSSYIEVFIWAWEKYLSSAIKKEFPFNFVIPEEALFNSKELSLFLLKRDSNVIITLSENHALKGFLFLRHPFSSEEILLFLKSQRKETYQIKKVYLYGFSKESALTFLPQELIPLAEFKSSVEEDLPSFFKTFFLKTFKVKYPLVIKPEEILLSSARLILMFVIALQLNLLFSYLEYKSQNKKLEKEIKAVDKKIAGLISFNKTSGERAFDEERIQALRELEDEYKAKKDLSYENFFYLLSEIARCLPDNSRITAFELKEKKLKLYLEARDLLEVLVNFRKNLFFSDLKLVSTPIYNRSKNLYNFTVEIALK